MTGSLILLELRVPQGQNFFNEKLRQRPQNGKLADRPSFAHEKAGDGLIEIDALIVQTVIMRNPETGFANRGVEFISDE